jgi:hypothetical protein
MRSGIAAPHAEKHQYSIGVNPIGQPSEHFVLSSQVRFAHSLAESKGGLINVEHATNA